ncbi:MAG: hypothetical protein UR81_C0034G0002 [Candidatus Levybacteria bacterium GW2011_GWB1_35_5]|nr:MAG: hypothetical protein UR81_C0034G0002 [Candidatus Levybacteria bacterium GW2011_GWB1_35_5]
MKIASEFGGLALALNMLGVPSVPVVASELASPQASSTAVTEARERNLPRYQLPLDILKDLVNISDPLIAQLYNKASQDPAGHIEIIDELGYNDVFLPGAFSYFFYSNKNAFADRTWSMMVAASPMLVEPMPTIIAIQLDKDLHIYEGSGDSLPLFSKVPEYVLQSISGQLFNEPPEMKDIPWRMSFNTPYSLPNYEQVFVDTNGLEYTMTVRPDNIIFFSAPYPSIPKAQTMVQNPICSPRPF